MKQITLGRSDTKIPAVAVGCMRLEGMEQKQAEHFIRHCLELGANFFDHADIYGGGVCETVFGKVLDREPSIRETMFIQSKCGIVPGIMFDFSKEHILSAVEGSLQRLHTDYLDMLLLHRPDALMEPEEVADAFDTLERQGKVRRFGISNMNPMQIELLKKSVRQELMVNQLQFSIPVSNMVSAGLEVNMTTDGAYDRDGSVLDYCRLHDITIQAWSPFQMPGWKGVFLGSPEYPELNQVIHQLAQDYDVTETMIAAAWIFRHPANMQLIAGTMNEKRIEEIIQATELTLTREEWYRLYLSAGHRLP